MIFLLIAGVYVLPGFYLANKYIQNRRRTYCLTKRGITSLDYEQVGKLILGWPFLLAQVWGECCYRKEVLLDLFRK